jgi:hypothetical protein
MLYVSECPSDRRLGKHTTTEHHFHTYARGPWDDKSDLLAIRLVEAWALNKVGGWIPLR